MNIIDNFKANSKYIVVGTECCRGGDVIHAEWKLVMYRLGGSTNKRGASMHGLSGRKGIGKPSQIVF